MVPLPTPPGPETMTTREDGFGAEGTGAWSSGSLFIRRAAARSLTQLFEQGALLLGAQALDTTVVGDADVFHHLAGLDLADAGEGLEQRHDLELADGRVLG